MVVITDRDNNTAHWLPTKSPRGTARIRRKNLTTRVHFPPPYHNSGVLHEGLILAKLQPRIS